MIWLQAAAHEIRCQQCRVTWYSWALRLLRIGGMAPENPGWRKMPIIIDASRETA
jgi:hypothetical protein